MKELNPLHSALYDKMRSELDDYIRDLLDEPPETILSHSWEYSTLEDILHCVQETEYTDLQMKALLESDHPLMDLYNAWAKLETDVMEQLGKCIKNTANAAWRESYKKSVACKEAIEKAISDNYRDNRLDPGCIDVIVSEYGYDRIFLVLATTVRAKAYDARISDKNKSWAATYPVYEAPAFGGVDRTRYFIVDKVNPGLTDIFLRLTRSAYAEKKNH